MSCRSILCSIILCGVAAGGSAAGAHAQAADTVVTVHRSQFVRAAKWTTLAASTGAAVYGFVMNRRADDGYEELEALCEANRENCLNRSNGGYADPDLERRYQDVVELDGRARNALLGSQLGIAASVILFVYDLRSASPPRGIPYEPRDARAFQVAPARDGGMQLRMTLPAGSRR